MNNLLSDITRAGNYLREQLKSHEGGMQRVLPVLDHLSADCTLNAFGGNYWFTTKSREDVVLLMTLAQRWTKVSDGTAIRYRAVTDGTEYWITAQDGALPPTCKLVEEEVEIPAQPARTAKVLVLRCDSVSASHD